MKLVDILARELKEWPERADWVVSVAEPGDKFTASFGCGNFPVPDPFDRNFHTWSVLRTGGQWEFVSRSAISQKPVDRLEAIVTRAQWQAAVDALKSDRCAHDYANKHGGPECGEMASPAWVGVGLPPVGVVCEVDGSSSADGWGKCTIRYSSSDVIVFKRDEYDFESFDCVASAHSFRPIRTPEQLAAEARESAIKDLMHIDDIYHEQAAAIYDAGYRKVQP